MTFTTLRTRRPYRHRQSGTILPLVAIGLLAVFGFAGMAIDSGHAFVNVTRVQNAVDAAALSAAKSLHLYGKDTTLATAHGTETFTDHLERELGDDLEVTFTYSNTLSPFSAGGADPDYVRATVTAHTIPVWFARVLPGIGDTFTIGTTAVSGPLPLGGGTVCDVAPLLVCAPAPGDSDSSDGFLYGLPMGEDAPESCLKQEYHDGGNGGGGDNGGGSNDSGGSCPVGVDGSPTLESGNFYLSRINCPGGACVREALAGGYEGCTDLAGSVQTEPGNTVGPTRQGLNTRFNIYQGGGVDASQYPPDLVVSPGKYSAYKAAYEAEAWETDGEEQRRILAVPIADCAGIQNGASTVPVLSLGCYFLTQPVPNSGGGSGSNSYIVGQLIEECETSGQAGPNNGPQPENGPYKIVLFNDPDNQGS